MRLNRSKEKEQELKQLLTREYLHLFGGFFLVLFLGFFFTILLYLDFDFHNRSERMAENYQELLQEKTTVFETSSLNFLYPISHTRVIDTFADPASFEMLEVREVMDALKAIAGPFIQYANISIYNLDGRQISVGKYNGLIDNNFIEDPQLSSGFQKERESTIFFNQEAKNVVYLRPYYTNFKKTGLVSIEMDAEVFFQDFLTDENTIKMVIYDGMDNVIFENETAFKSKFIWERTIKEDRLNEWKIAYSVNRFQLLPVLIHVTLFCFLLFIFFFGVLYRLTDNLSKRVSFPIKQVSELLETSNFKNPKEIELVSFTKKHQVKELDLLNESVVTMINQLAINLEELLIAKEVEKKVSISNITSQTNPHFLYNILTNIVSLSELEMTEEIIQLAESSAEILRYSSKGYDEIVSLQKEIEVLENYTKMMVIRYGERVNVNYEIPEKMRQIKVPKMILLSILENAFKHGADEEGNWIVAITGIYYHDTSWEIRISDQGKGMSLQQIETFNSYSQYTFSDVYELFRNMEHTGMLNAYLRVRYYFEEKALLFLLPAEKGTTIIFNRWD
ncbi:sensor histidine kinase [Enterococcus sp. DIV0213h]|uniref:sensor histidine kinase n=1 Tax=Enterococcus sp. DIV0213h TaxID=2774669 RepID=UPI003F23F296